MLIHTGDALPTNQPVALTLRERKRLQLLAWRYRVQREARLRPMGEVLLERRPAGGQECPGLPACRRVRGHPSLPPGGPAHCSRHAGGAGVRVDRLGSARLAVVGLDTTTGQPPVIVEAVVYRLTGGVITAGPFSYWAAPDVGLGEVPARCWPNMRLAPPWAEVAPHLLDALDQRTVVVHEPGRLDQLSRHLPDWPPAGVLSTRDLAEQQWPGLTDYGLDALTALISDNRLRRVGPGATAEAHATALLLGVLLTYPDGPARRDRTRAAGPGQADRASALAVPP